MGLSGLGSLVSYLRRVTPASEGGDDAQLLARFGSGDELAFAALVHRYAALVWGVCRRVLPCQADAEDAFQATFLVLLQKAPALGRGPLGPWLHRVASRTAVKARARAARQAGRESAAALRQADTPPAGAPDGLRELLDEEVGRLPEKYRLPVVLCYLEGLTNEQAAQRLGCPHGTVLSRLSRARDQLRRRLSRHGVDLPAALPALCVPAALLETVVHAGPAARAGAFSSSVQTLAQGVLFGMSMHKLRLFAVALITLAAAAGAGLLASRPAGPAAAARLTARAAQDKGTAAAPAAKEGKEKKADEKAVVTDDEIPETLRETREFYGLDDPNLTLQEVLENLTKRYRVRFDVNERAFIVEGVADVLKVPVARAPIPPMKTTLTNVLRKVLSRIPSTSPALFLVRKDHVEITTENVARVELGLRAFPGDDPLDDAKGGPGEPALPPLVFETLKKAPLEKALRDVAAAAEVNVVIDARVKEKINLEVTTTFRNVPVETALEVLADMAGLTVVYRNNIFYVTTPENAEKLRKTKRWDPEPRRGVRPQLAGAGM